MMAITFLRRGINVLSAICLVLAAMPVFADEHHHHTNAQSSTYILKSGEKWKTDEVVWLGMDNIRQAISANQNDIVNGRLSAHDYQRIASVVDKNVAEIVKNCRLSEGADSAFHSIVLLDLLDGVTFMRTSQNIQAQRVGALGVLQTLRNYGKYFQHTGWSLDVVNLR